MSKDEEDFFLEQTIQSQAKATIVSKYFDAWANILSPTSKELIYIDLFAGPGVYKDGQKTTPILILEKAIGSDRYRDKLFAVFNDIKPKTIELLKENVNKIQQLNLLKNYPQFHSIAVDENIVDFLKPFAKRNNPILLFADPWGYKSLSLELIKSVLPNFGCDCILFFNYTRINMAITNELFQDSIENIFGKERAERLKQSLKSLDAGEREFAVIEEFTRAIEDIGGKYVLPFRFRSLGGEKTSHYIIFVSKKFKGYSVMKEVMKNEASNAFEHNGIFEFNPVDKKFELLFHYTKGLDTLSENIFEAFHGKTFSFKQIFEKHSYGNPFLASDYRHALASLEVAGRISVRRQSKQSIQKKKTYSDSDIVKFMET